jgi:ribonuclease J
MPERDIAPVLDRVFARATGRIVVASFASHVHRAQQVVDAAAAHGRKVALVGRSMVRTMTVAQELGDLHVKQGTMVEVGALSSLPPNRVVFLSRGSEGGPMAALSRIANRSHPQISIDSDDVVVLASSLIPGNENAVSRVINGITRLGATVVHKGNAAVHTSGHASAAELLHTYRIVRPRNVVPVHGEPRHLRANAALAEATGLDRDHVVVVENGVAVDLLEGRLSVAGAVRCGHVFVDGSTVGELAEAGLQDRRILGVEGFISVVVVIDLASGSVVSGPDIHARGLAEEDVVFDPLRPMVLRELETAMRDGVEDRYQLQQLIRRTVGRWVSRQLRRRPMIIPVVVDL